MIGQKILKTLQTLDPATFRRLGDAFASPYFTNSPLLLKLYTLLKKEYPAFDTRKLNKEKIFKALYPGKPFNDGALRVLVREFARITEDFVVFESLKNDESSHLKMLTRWYGEHNLYAEFEKSTHTLLAKMEIQPYRDVEYFNDAAGLYASYFFHEGTEKHTLDDQVLTQLMESMDRSYILFKMRVASEMKNRERILSKQYDIPLLNETIALGAAELLKDNLPFRMYNMLFTMYPESDNPETFYALKDLFTTEIGKLRPFDQSMMITQLCNYAVLQLNKGNNRFSKELFELYQLAITYNLLLSNGKIEAAVYQNIVSSGCREKELVWTKEFVKEYTPFLDADIRQDCQTMALAMISFNQSEYDQAIQLITKHHFFNVLIQINARTILAKAWFEKFILNYDCYDQLIYQLDANEKFTRRNNIVSRLKKEENLNFLMTLRQLVLLITEKKPASFVRSRLENNLNSRYPIISKDWFLLKIDQYDSKRQGE